MNAERLVFRNICDIGIFSSARISAPARADPAAAHRSSAAPPSRTPRCAACPARGRSDRGSRRPRRSAPAPRARGSGRGRRASAGPRTAAPWRRPRRPSCTSSGARDRDGAEPLAGGGVERLELQRWRYVALHASGDYPALPARPPDLPRAARAAPPRPRRARRSARRSPRSGISSCGERWPGRRCGLSYSPSLRVEERRCGGGGSRPVLADVLARGEHGALGRVGLRRQRQVDRGLGERELALGQADVLDRGGGRGRDHERLGIGVADVLGGEHDHPADDEARVLAALEHHRQVVQRGVRIRAARRLDPGRDRVVVAVGLAVVEQRAPLQRVLGVGERRPARRPRPPRTPARAPFSAVRASPPERSARNSSASGSISARLARTRRAARARRAARGCPPRVSASSS